MKEVTINKELSQLTAKDVGKAFKTVAPDYMNDYDDEEERKQQICFFMDLLQELGFNPDSDKVMKEVGLDPDMD